jgi:hypothetical protein
MTKKDYILTLLTKLDGSREMAGPLKMLIEHTDIDDEFINGLSALLMQAVHEVDDEVQKKRLTDSQAVLKKLQAVSSEWDISDEELDEILASL